jgi:hypothetical protein
MNVITQYTDYVVNTPNWFIKYIKDSLKGRDIPGLTGGIIQGIRVSGTHPLVQLTATFLEQGGSELNVQGLLPAITVIENDVVEEEDIRTFGYNERPMIEIDQAYVDKIKAMPMETRIQEGLISDKQLQSIEAAINNSETGKLGALQDGHMEREDIMISLWTNTLQDRQIIGKLLKSIVYHMRKAMVARGLKDISIRTANGLVNMNFGQTLHGMEIIVRYLNTMHNITVLDTEPSKLDKVLDDLIDGPYGPMSPLVNADLRFAPNDGINEKVDISNQTVGEDAEYPENEGEE